MANKNNSKDNNKAPMRFVDQPGQWVDVTPESVKRRQEKAWAKLMAMTNNGKDIGKNK